MQRFQRFALLGSLLFVPSLAQAQASIGGAARDTSGAILPGVSVAVKNVGTGAARTAVTGEDGHWTMPALPVGTYEVVYEMTGFKKLVRDRVEVEASVPRTLEDKLEVGEIGIVVNIAEGAALITPETSTVARQLSSSRPQPRTGSPPPPRVYMIVSRSGQIRRPCNVMSSAVLAITVSSAVG